MNHADLALCVSRLTKIYHLYHKPIDQLKELLFRQRSHTDFVALQDVSFELPHGRTLGIIGDNGAGKSTLLHIIAGTLTPTSGSVKHDGSVLGLLELGVGFHAEFTGRQNIFLYGDILGLSRRLIQSRFSDIVAFSEMESFIDQPLRTYSTGMRMRLAFSLVTTLEPDLLIVDEALSVGDVSFQKKCIDRMMEFKNRGHTILLCSHSLYQISMFCDETVWLQGGRIRMQGQTAQVIPAYEAWQAQRNTRQEVAEEKLHSNLPVRIISLDLLNQLPCRCGDDLQFRLQLDSISNDLPFHVTLSIKMDNGRGVYVTGTHLSGQPPLRGRQRNILITYPQSPLLGGIYSAHARVFDDQGLVLYHEKVLSDLEILKDSHEMGICYLENRWEIS